MKFIVQSKTTENLLTKQMKQTNGNYPSKNVQQNSLSITNYYQRTLFSCKKMMKKNT